MSNSLSLLSEFLQQPNSISPARPEDVLEAPTNVPALVHEVMRPLASLYRRRDIEELVMNRFGYVMIKPRGADWVEVAVPKLTQHYIYDQLCLCLANLNKIKYHPNTHPVIRCNIPGEPFRFTAVTGNTSIYDYGDEAVGGIALAIRSNLSVELGFEKYGLEHGKGLARQSAHGVNVTYSSDPLEDLLQAVANHKSVIVAGGMGTGKTSFLNGLLRQVPLTSRIITMQDAFELQVPHVNRVHLRGPGTHTTTGVTWDDLIDCVTRLTPDVIVGGEISRKSTIAFFRAMTVGHQFFTTIHAASAKEALSAFVQNLKAAGDTSDYDTLYRVLSHAIGRIVVISHVDNQRRVTEIANPADLLNKDIFDRAQIEAQARRMIQATE